MEVSEKEVTVLKADLVASCAECSQLVRDFKETQKLLDLKSWQCQKLQKTADSNNELVLKLQNVLKLKDEEIR
jgi:hypothetical protein